MLTRDIRPKITLETYTSYPSLKRVAIPIAAGKNGETVGLIQKVRELDPMIAKNSIFIDTMIVDRVHSKIGENGQIENLISSSSLSDIERFFNPVESLANDDVVKYATRSNFLRKNKSGLYNWQGSTINNGGFLIKPQILLKNLNGYKDENGFEITRDDMPSINPCSYYNEEGLRLENSKLEDFIRVMDLPISDNTKYKNIHIATKELVDVSMPLSKSSGQFITNLLVKGKDTKSEKERAYTLSKITGLTEKEAIKKFSISSSMNDDKRNDVARKLIESTKLHYEESSADNRDKACKIVTVLGNLQDRKGWHNRITPLESVDTPQKAKMTLNNLSEPSISSDLNLASKNIEDTANILQICYDKTDSSSCIHPADKANLGLYGRNKDGKIPQKSWIEGEMRAYALIDVPLTFFQRGNSEDRVSLVQKYKKGIQNASINNDNPLDNVHSFSKLSRFGEISNLPMIDPNTSVINFAPDSDPDIRTSVSGREESEKRVNKSVKISEKISEYYSGASPALVSSEVDAFTPISRSEMENDSGIWNAYIRETMVYPHQLMTHPKDPNEENIHVGCLRTQLQHEKGSISINSGDLVLLDGKNDLIRWKDSNNKRKTVKQVYSEILSTSGDEQKADPHRWKWACIADGKIDPSYLNKLPEENQFKIKKFVSRRSVELDYRKNTDKIKLAVDSDSVANALKDIAIDASNAIHLGGITQMKDYIDGGNSILFKEENDWNTIRKGGNIEKRQASQELMKTIDSIQNSFGTKNQFNIIKNLVSNEKNVSINSNSIWFDPQSKILVQRRKDIATSSYGLPKDLFINPVRKTLDGRMDSKSKAILSLETNLDEIFSMLND